MTMPSSPVMTPGVLTGVGSGFAVGAGVPDLTGLGGLFGALMGATTGAQSLGDGLLSVRFGGNGAEAVLPDGLADALGEAGFDVNTFLAAQGVTEQVVQLEEGAPAVTVKGDSETVAAFMVQVKEIYQKVILQGGLTLDGAGDSGELAQALQKMGMDAETAMGVAERIETMMKLLEQYQDKQNELDAETAGTLVAMMLAVMGQGVQAAEGEVAGGQSFSLQITTVEQTVTVTSRTLTAWKSSGDITQDLLAMGQVGTKAADAADAPAPQAVKVQTLEVSVTRDGETAKIGMFMPSVEAPTETVTEVPVADAAVSNEEVSLAARAPVSTHAVSRAEVVEAPEGETYYTLKADENGTETVEAVKPVPQGKDVVADAVADASAKPADAAGTKPDTAAHGEWMQQQRADAVANPALSSQAAASGTGYAERFEMIQSMLDKAQVAKQVAVQIQPLLDRGGGTVRLQLNPVELGQITVELSVENGKVQGAIAASEPKVVEQLARELHTLRQGLADAGLKVSEQGINLMLSSNNGNGQFGHQGGQAAPQAQGGKSRSANGGAGLSEIGTEGESLATNLAAWVSPDRMLDLNV